MDINKTIPATINIITAKISVKDVDIASVVSINIVITANKIVSPKNLTTQYPINKVKNINKKDHTTGIGNPDFLCNKNITPPRGRLSRNDTLSITTSTFIISSESVNWGSRSILINKLLIDENIPSVFLGIVVVKSDNLTSVSICSILKSPVKGPVTGIWSYDSESK